MKQDLALHPLLLDNVAGVVFDLDGTLIDSAGDIVRGMHMTFEQAGLGALPAGYVPDNLHGTTESIIRFIAADLGWALPADVNSLTDLYLANAATLGLRHTQMYEGALDVLKSYADSGIAMGICTNKSEAGALFSTRRFGIQEMFGFITGCDTWGAAKPSPIPLLETLRSLDVEPAQCLYFGDTSADAECAWAAGVRFVLHEAGYGDPDLRDLPRHLGFGNWNELLVTEDQASFL